MAEVSEKNLNGEGLAALWELIKAEDNALSDILTALVSEKAKVVTGSYTGDSTVKRKISLGFTPIAVLITSYAGVMNCSGDTRAYGGLAVTGFNVSQSPSNGYTSWDDANTIIQIADDGFFVNYNSDKWVGSNYNKVYYNYIAIG